LSDDKLADKLVEFKKAQEKKLSEKNSALQ